MESTAAALFTAWQRAVDRDCVVTFKVSPEDALRGSSATSSSLLNLVAGAGSDDDAERGVGSAEQPAVLRRPAAAQEDLQLAEEGGADSLKGRDTGQTDR